MNQRHVSYSNDVEHFACRSRGVFYILQQSSLKPGISTTVLSIILYYFLYLSQSSPVVSTLNYNAVCSYIPGILFKNRGDRFCGKYANNILIVN